MVRRGKALFQFDKSKALRLKQKSNRINIVGIDESGRGPWAGPVVACAVVLPPNFSHPHLADSKIVPLKKRRELFKILSQNTLWGLGIVEVEVIDSINIWQATHLAMKRALEMLLIKHPHIEPDLIMVDGLPIPSLGRFKQESIVKGDTLSAAIAAASILAKVSRDELMGELDRQYPVYGFAKHKGYGTKFHREKLAEFGPSPIHRKSFAPVRDVL